MRNNPLTHIDPSGHWDTNITANWTINEMKWQWSKAFESNNTTKMQHWANEANKLRDRMRASGMSEASIMQSSDSSISQALVSQLAKISTLSWIESDPLGIKLYTDAANLLIPDPTSATGTLNGPGKFFNAGQLFESKFSSKSGLNLGALAEVAVDGKKLILKDFAIYAEGSEVKNAVGAKEFIQWKNLIVDMAKNDGYETLELQGVRVTNSTSANPGKSINQIIDLTK